MNLLEKTHYRKAFKSPYLSSADITEPTVLTIAFVKLELNKTKQDQKMLNTAYFVEREIRKGEQLKPMVLNATNSKMLSNITNSPFLEDWQNIQVVVQVVKGIKFGRESVDGLRISQVTHAQKIQTPTEQEYQQALASIDHAENRDQLYLIFGRFKGTGYEKNIQTQCAAKSDKEGWTA